MNRNQSQPLLTSMLVGLGTMTALIAMSIPSIAQINLATLLEILGDNNEVFIENQVAEENDNAVLGEEVRTEQARAQLSFNNGAAGRIDENSAVTVGQCIEVEQGVIITSGPANGCISDFAVGVEGTIYVMTVDEDNLGAIEVLEGEIQLRQQDNLDNPNPLIIVAGQKVSGLQQGLLLDEIVIENLTKEEYEAIITSSLFRDYQQPLPDEDKLNEVCQQLYGECLAVGSEPPPTATPTPIRGLW